MTDTPRAVDTSREAVEWLISSLEELGWPSDLRAARAFRALLAERDALRAEVATLAGGVRAVTVAVVNALVQALDTTHESPAFKAVWTLHHVHGGR